MNLFTLALLLLTVVKATEVLEPRDVTIPDYIKKFKGTTYTPFDQNHQCRTPDQIKTDISNLASFELLRLYLNDCSVVQYAAEVFPGKLLVAVNDISSPRAILDELFSIAASIGFAGKTFDDTVHLVIVGNELVYNNWHTAEDVINYINQARAVFPNFSGKWTTGETVSSFYGHPELCSAVDYIAVNNHPFFDGQTQDTAGEYVLGHIQAVAAFCQEHGSNKEVLTIETGWPWKGNANGVSVPSSENQVTALKKISEAAGDACIAFSAYNELWKDGSVNGGVEQSWGFLGNAPSAW